MTAEPVVSELQEALGTWRGCCIEGIQALEARDMERLERALADRETLQPRISALVASREGAGGASAGEFATLERLLAEASAADGQLLSRLADERARLRRDIDGGARASAPVRAYGRGDASSPHRLDIVR